jgi:hypothetical protein
MQYEVSLAVECMRIAMRTGSCSSGRFVALGILVALANHVIDSGTDLSKNRESPAQSCILYDDSDESPKGYPSARCPKTRSATRPERLSISFRSGGEKLRRQFRSSRIR